MSDDYDISKMKIGPCAVSFKGTVLGATQGGIKVKVEPIYHETKCDQAGETVVRKVLIGFKVTIETPLMEITDSMALILDDDSKITESMIGTDIFDSAGALLLTPINQNDTVGRQFPKAVPLPGFEDSYSYQDDRIVPLVWEAMFDDNGVLMEEIAVNGTS